MSENGTSWHITGDEVASCNCVWACPCQFEGNPSEGFCEAVVGFQINDGSYGETRLEGVKFAIIVGWPGSIPEGDGHIQLVLDESASDDQREVIKKLASGSEGGAYFEIFSAVCPHKRDPITAPIEMEFDRETREASMKIGDIAQAQIEPIKSPVDGSEHRVRIDLPGGFEYKQAEIANTVAGGSSADEPLGFTLENTYAQLNAFDWSNA